MTTKFCHYCFMNHRNVNHRIETISWKFQNVITNITTLWFPQTTKYYPVIIPLTWFLFSLPSARPRKRLPISSQNGGCNQPEEQIENQLLENDLLSPLQKEAKWNGISPYLESTIRDESIPTQSTKHTRYSVSNVFAALNLDEDNFGADFTVFTIAWRQRKCTVVRRATVLSARMSISNKNNASSEMQF